MVSEPDEFERRARRVLSHEPQLVEQLLLLRKQIQRQGEEAWSQAAPPSAESLNDANRRMIDRAATLLGSTNFERVFGFAPDEKFDIVDPRIMQAAKQDRPSEKIVQRGSRDIGPSDVRRPSWLSTRTDDSRGLVARGEIFLVDEDPAVRDTLSMVLKTAGYEVTGFADGATLLSVARNRVPAAILLDVHISGTSGLEILKELHGEDYPAPIFMISGQGDIAMAVSAIKNGALDFIEKPFRGSEIIGRLDEAISAYARRQAENASPKFGSLHFPGREPLTRREREVLEQFASGASNKQASRTLGISPRTIEDHRANIMRKLGARSVADLIRIAITAAQRWS